MHLTIVPDNVRGDSTKRMAETADSGTFAPGGSFSKAVAHQYKNSSPYYRGLGETPNTVTSLLVDHQRTVSD